MTHSEAALTGADRRHLRKLAHTQKPIVFVGEAGVSDAVIAALDQALRDHELVKVKLTSGKAKREVAGDLAKRCRAHLGGLVGHMVILYRPHPEDPQITLPGSA